MSAARADVVATVRRIGRTVAGVHADDVDLKARFPFETLEALREERLLGQLIDVEDGGLGHDLADAAAGVRELARWCSSSAMILAMHHLQIACLVRHGDTPVLRSWVREAAALQLLVASSTTEAGQGGDIRSSTCAVERQGEGPAARFHLAKEAPVISYGEYADAVLVTARRHPEAVASDQVMVLCRRDELGLEPVSGWDTLGLRGTCSRGFRLTAAGSVDAVLPESFADISEQTNLPWAHVLWAAAWCGIADEAADRARRLVQKAARKTPGVPPPSALRLVELLEVHGRLAGLLAHLTDRVEAPERSARFAVDANLLKVSAAELVVEVVNRAMGICGIAGYREDTDVSLGRLLRDAHGAAVMVNNDRILGNTVDLMMLVREI